MSTKREVRDFLVSRRARITLEMSNLPDFGGDRRVPGLRREEVAMLADVSLDYYTRLERGNIRGASEAVLGAIARALQLNDAETEYLFDLARSIPAVSTPRRAATPDAVRTSVRRVLDNMPTPAVVTNTNQDILVANLMGRALFAPLFDTDAQPNFARFTYLDSRARSFYIDWALARYTVSGMMRLEAGRNPLNPDLTALIGELSTRSVQFRTDWSGHDVYEHRTGVKAFHHPEVGRIDVAFDVFGMAGEAGLQIVTYSSPPGSETAEKFALLQSWAATLDGEEPAAAQRAS